MQGALRHICIFWNFKTFPQRSGIFIHVPGMYISSALTKRAHVTRRHDTNKVTCWTSRNLNSNALPLSPHLRSSPVLSLLYELLVVSTRAYYTPISSRDHGTASEGVQVSMNFLVVIFLSRYILSSSEEVHLAFHQAVVTLALLVLARLMPHPILLSGCFFPCSEVFSLICVFPRVLLCALLGITLSWSRVSLQVQFLCCRQFIFIYEVPFLRFLTTMYFLLSMYSFKYRNK